MPRDIKGKYWVQGPYQQQTISRMSRQVYPHSRSSIVEYATVENMMERVDGVGNAWYNIPADNLYLCDFVFFTRMQTVELLLSLLGANQARNRRAEGFRVAGCAVIGQRDGAKSR